ncbi:MAG: 2-amino-4-hydroxy-6-hydroxymethyldihydropteridine diphosphokinase [Chitinophagales bacterium]|nr:2-amino-4-hydroxy-6-hydroxymethyldihydropteridine diphosphokinase [Chitinophagales bacterium]
MNKAYLLLGSNEGDRTDWLNKATQQLQDSCGNITQRSALYETAAWGIEDQPSFLNMALSIDTELQPLELLKQINSIEANLGRQRTLKWGQRTLDIDILFYNDAIINEPDLIIPHPQLEKRRFALVPLNEIAATLAHPVSHKTIAQLLGECEDTLEAKRFIPNP